MFIVLCLVSGLALSVSALTIPNGGPVVRLDNAVRLDTCDFHPVDIDALHNAKNFTGSVNGNLTSFLGIPFAKPPYAPPMSPHLYRVLITIQYRKQAFLPS